MEIINPGDTTPDLGEQPSIEKIIKQQNLKLIAKQLTLFLGTGGGGENNESSPHITDESIQFVVGALKEVLKNGQISPELIDGYQANIKSIETGDKINKEFGCIIPHFEKKYHLTNLALFPSYEGFEMLVKNQRDLNFDDFMPIFIQKLQSVSPEEQQEMIDTMITFGNWSKPSSNQISRLRHFYDTENIQQNKGLHYLKQLIASPTNTQLFDAQVIDFDKSISNLIKELSNPELVYLIDHLDQDVFHIFIGLFDSDKLVPSIMKIIRKFDSSNIDKLVSVIDSIRSKFEKIVLEEYHNKGTIDNIIYFINSENPSIINHFVDCIYNDLRWKRLMSYTSKKKGDILFLKSKNNNDILKYLELCKYKHWYYNISL